MKYKYLINPQHQNMLESLIDVEAIFHKASNTIHKARNELKIIEINGIKYVVKSFKVPHFINKVAYTFLRDSKAKKSYTNAMQLKELQVNTPEPVGYIEFFKDTLFSNSYFIALYEPYDFTIREALFHQVDDYKEIIKQFVQFTFYIQRKGVSHIDYSPGNILITKTADKKYIFNLVDINRMRFGVISVDQGAQNFNKLWAEKDDVEFMIDIYSELSKLPRERVSQIFYASIQEIEEIKQKKQKLKNLLKTLLPSSKLKTDVTFKCEECGTLKPISLLGLSLINPMKKKLLRLREENSEIHLKREMKKLSLIIPYRHREEHLKTFLPAIEKALIAQSIEYEIIIAQQDDASAFNRAKLMNIATLYASQSSAYYLFHDVDLLPKNIDYRYVNYTTRPFSFIEENGINKKFGETIFGGATLVPKEIFLSINGFSNNYTQWGKEDDDFLLRHLIKGFVPLLDTKGEFTALPHPPSIQRDVRGEYVSQKKILQENQALYKKNKARFSDLKRGITHQEDDGINNITDYTISSIHKENNITTVKIVFTQ